MYIERRLNLAGVLKKKSCFLFGPRQTGKSSLIRHALKKHRVYNLLDSETYLKLSRSPSRLREECQPSDKIIIIDEVQKLPVLLDEVHFLIEERGLHFLLTGSSARKLRRGGVNLLGGRAWTRHLHPFTSVELGDKFDIIKAVNRGLLPPVYVSNHPEEDLRAYVGTYLREEVAAEGLRHRMRGIVALDENVLIVGPVVGASRAEHDAELRPILGRPGPVGKSHRSPVHAEQSAARSALSARGW